MKKKILILLITLCIMISPLKIFALEAEKNWNTYTRIIPSGSVGKEYSFKLETTEYDLSKYVDSLTETQPSQGFTYSAESENLPEGLTLSEDGTLSGTPTKAGKYSFYVIATRAITGDGQYYGIRYISTFFNMYIYENDIDYSGNITITSDESLGVYDKKFNKIDNDGDLSIISSTCSYNGDGYAINNTEDVYLYDVTFSNGKSVIYNDDRMELDDVTFYYNNSDDYIIYNDRTLILNNIKLTGNKSSKYVIYTDKGSVILNGKLNTLVLNDNDYTKDTIYIGRNSEFYFDIRNGSSTISDYSKLQGYYGNNLNVIISEDMDNDKEYVLIENYATDYTYKNGLLKEISVSKDEPYIEFVTTDNGYHSFDRVAYIGINESFTYNNHVYKLVVENKKLILKISKVSTTSASNDLPITGTAVDNSDINESIDNQTQVGDIVTEELNVKNVIILSSCIMLVVAAGIVVFIKINKKKKTVK